MNVSRNQAVPLLIGIIVIALLLVATVFFSLQPFITIIGVIIGAVISITSQFLTQRFAWKREYSIKAIEQIYSPLFGVVLAVEKLLEKNDFTPSSFGHWDSCRKDYRFFMVDTKFREKLDAFYNRIEKRTERINRLDSIIIPKAMSEIISNVFHITNDASRDVYLEIHFYHNSKQLGGSSVPVKVHLKTQDTIDTITNNLVIGLNIEKAEVNKVLTKVVFWKAENPSDTYSSNDQELNKLFWDTCLEKVASIPEYQVVVNEEQVLLEEVRAIKKELIKRIEEPWKAK